MSIQLFAAPQIEINLDLDADTLGTVTPALLGVNNPMPKMTERAGFNPNTGEFPEAFLDAVKSAGAKSLRFPGGNISGSYFWQNGIGPLEKRPAGFDGSTGAPEPDYYHFGFLEFMDFMESFGASDPIICINFGISTAADASAWVEFVNAQPGIDPNKDGMDHAQMRVDLGYPEPFHIQYWEIGNELGEPYKHMFSWHFGQKPDGSEDYVQTVRNYIFGGNQWQYQDMQSRDDGQRVTQKNNWSMSASNSNGKSNQSFFIKYPPADPDSFSLAICEDASWGVEWQQIGDLSQAGSEDQAYQFNPITGEITFGDGVHGTIPPTGFSVRVKYKSIEQEGLVDFFEAMKKADPPIKIGAPFADETFFSQITMENLDVIPFDFIVDHPYDSGQDLLLELEHWRIHALADRHVTRLQDYRNTLDLLSKGNPSLGIWISEYNLVYRLFDRDGSTSNPWYGGKQLDFFGRSLGQGLYIAGSAMNMLETADKTKLMGLNIHALVTDSETALADWPVTGMIGPSPQFYLNPSALIYGQLSQSVNHTIISSNITNGPAYALSVKAIDPEGREAWNTDTLYIPYLKCLATVNSNKDSLCVFVLNRASGLEEAQEKQLNITATLSITNEQKYNHLTIQQINAPNLWSINSSTRPEVMIKNIHEGDEILPETYTFPAHSLTILTGTVKSTNNIKLNEANTFCLHPIKPNPFNESATIRFNLSKSGQAEVTLYNVMGQKVKTLLHKNMTAGAHTLRLNGTKLASGLYFIRLSSNGSWQQHKCILLK